ncbi:hypothetical protein [Streptomyces fragilis]|uniref:Uncharacterized protein n=1 Tax=Streptomyces fragilis TaxID=67301 RepID=A0ABV2YQN4_9ACTN|nr:hypothetical protein [Streptomyces fragilis]
MSTPSPASANGPLARYRPHGHRVEPAEHLLDTPGFWPAYLGWTLVVEGVDPELFGADLADLDAALEAVGATEVWPAFRVPLSDGRVHHVVPYNLPDDYGSTEFLLEVPGADTLRTLGVMDPHDFHGGGLTWRETVEAADAVPSGDGGHRHGVLDPDHRLLLLLPAWGGVDTPAEEALTRIAHALAAVGVPDASAAALAEHLVDARAWGLST